MILKNLKKLENSSNIISEVRGAGLLLGIKTNISNIDFSEQLKKNKLLNVPAADNTVRLAPPLIVSYNEIDSGIPTGGPPSRCGSSYHSSVQSWGGGGSPSTGTAVRPHFWWGQTKD